MCDLNRARATLGPLLHRPLNFNPVLLQPYLAYIATTYVGASTGALQARSVASHSLVQTSPQRSSTPHRACGQTLRRDGAPCWSRSGERRTRGACGQACATARESGGHAVGEGGLAPWCSLQADGAALAQDREGDAHQTVEAQESRLVSPGHVMIQHEHGSRQKPLGEAFCPVLALLILVSVPYRGRRTCGLWSRRPRATRPQLSASSRRS